jgi:methyltransferase
MGVSRIAYIALLCLVGAERLVELAISRAHQRRMAAVGAKRVPEAHFAAMVFLHTGVLVGAGAEVLFLHRRLIPALAAVMLVLFLLANALRAWAMVTLREHWNAQVMDSVGLGVVDGGPYRLVRHPNYVAVFVELITLPLIYSAWITAVAAALVDSWVLRERIRVEDPVLFANADYRARMGRKPAFLPRL